MIWSSGGPARLARIQSANATIPPQSVVSDPFGSSAGAWFFEARAIRRICQRDLGQEFDRRDGVVSDGAAVGIERDDADVAATSSRLVGLVREHGVVAVDGLGDVVPDIGRLGDRFDHHGGGTLHVGLGGRLDTPRGRKRLGCDTGYDPDQRHLFSHDAILDSVGHRNFHGD